jgi:DNA-binding winged helix-turn-helix (wHTH) protein/Tol biopolymer transport system component
MESPPSVGFHPASRRIVRFAGFRADLTDSSLWRDGEEVKLPPRALGVLFYLLDRPGRVVSKAALLDAVWKDSHVTEASLIEAVGILRQALGDDAQNPRIIQTVHRRGYRMVASIAIEQPAADLEVVRAESALASTPDGGSDAAESDAHRSRAWLRWVPAAAIVAVGLAALWLWLNAEPTPDVTRVTITLPPDQAPAPALSANPVVALSPDGRDLVYVAGKTGDYRLFIRRLGDFSAQPLPGTEGGHGPFFSSDGRHIGFFSKGRLMRVSRAGGDPLVVTQAAGSGLGGTWTSDDRIVFAPGPFDGLWEVSAGGGTPQRLVPPPDAASGYRWPHALPDARTIVATRWRSNVREAAIVLIGRPTGGVTDLVGPASDGRVLGGRTLLFVNNGTLMAAPFSGTTVGVPRGVVDRVMVGATGAAQFSTSGTGDLVYIPDDPDRTERTIAYADRTGTLKPTALPPRAYQNLSVCGHLVAATMLEHGVSDLWVGDLDRGTLSRLTRAGTSVEPVWRPGCQKVLFGSSRDGVVNIYEIDTNGDGMRRLHPSERVQVPASLTPDGRRLFFTEIAPSTGADIWSVEDGPAEVYLRGPTSESAARVSPDGRFLAYQVDDRGSSQVFVTSARGREPRVPVSPAGAAAPSWSLDGRRLYFRQHPGEIAAVDVTGTSAAIVSRPTVVLKRPDLVLGRAAPDGLLVLLRGKEQLPLTRLLLVLNWRTELMERLRDRH